MSAGAIADPDRISGVTRGQLPEGGRQTLARAIVLGVEHPRAVAAVQSLGRAGIRVVAVDHDPEPTGWGSRYLYRKFQVESAPEKAMDFLEDLGRDGGGVLMPTNDHYLILVAKNADRLSRYFAVTTPPWETLGPLMDVARCYAMAREVGIRTPPFLKPQSEDEMRRLIAGLDLDRREYLLKTMPGSAPADARTGRFTKVAGADRASIERDCLEIFSRAGEFPAILEVIGGTADRCLGVCMVVDRNHEAALCFSVRRLRLHTYSKGGRFAHPYEMGSNVYCETIHDAEAEDAAKRLVRRAGYFGPIAVEFRRDPVDESLVLIKADPRFVRATSLSRAIGLDMPTGVYSVFSGRPVSKRGGYPDGVGWIWLTSYMTALFSHRSDRRVRGDLVGLMRNLGRIKAVAYFDSRDPLPFLVSLKRWSSGMAKSIGRALWRRVRFAARPGAKE
jgi:predicted ATP-grasp superfamily ATP-dependent carboligase